MGQKISARIFFQCLPHNLELWRVYFLNWFNFHIMFLNWKLPCLNLWVYWKTFLINIKMGGSELDGLFKTDQLVVWSLLCVTLPFSDMKLSDEWRHPDTGHTLCNSLCHGPEPGHDTLMGNGDTRHQDRVRSDPRCDHAQCPAQSKYIALSVVCSVQGLQIRISKLISKPLIYLISFSFISWAE